MELIKIVEYTCPTCGTKTKNQSGMSLLCQECVNSFLARNVGLMQEESEEQGIVPGETNDE
jgi:DNA-directed RNA polymerase subunit RPC12/RpoP